MPYLSVNGVDHYYEWITQHQDAPGTHKPVMVFVHGWGGSARYWQSTAIKLSDRYDALLYDMRGFGRSRLDPARSAAAKSRGYDLETFADDLIALLDGLGLGQVDLNAHSMGGSVAVLLLNRYRDRIQNAILTCNGIFEYDRATFEAFYRFGKYVVQFRPQWLAKVPLAPYFFMTRFIHQSIPVEEKRVFLQDFLDADYETALGTIFTSVSKQATEVMPVEFQSLSVPTLLVSGQYDQIIPADLGKKAAALNPKVQYRLIPKTGHFPMLEAPDIYMEAVNDFLAMA
jgi:proline iminopeptidase